MATITFNNTDTSHLNGLAFNPGFEEVLDLNSTTAFVDGAMPTDPDTFTFTNGTGGPFNGFKLQFVGTGFNALATAGDITEVKILAPDGTLIATATGPFYDDDLADVMNYLNSSGARYALDNLFNGSDTVTGSGIADHATGLGYGIDTVLGGGGDDLLSGRYAIIAGEAGNDIIRLTSNSYDVEVHGANQDGSGGEAETDTLEIVAKTNEGASVQLNAVTDIDILRFAVSDPGTPEVDQTSFYVNLDASQIGAGLLSPTLAVEGSTLPLAYHRIYIATENDPTNLTSVNVDLSGWTFTNWDTNDQSYEDSIEIRTNSDAVVNDNIVGSMVRDYIETEAGDDVLRGGLGDDNLYGGLGNDTFIYGANEATGDEYANGGYDDVGGEIDKVLLLGNNDFSDGGLSGMEQIIFQGAATATFDQWSLYFDPEDYPLVIVGDGNANGLAFVLEKDTGYPNAIDLTDLQFQSWTAGSDFVSIRGTNAKDVMTGSTQGDIMAGGKGSDDLQGNEGGDAFLFDFAPGRGVDHIADFNRKEGDMIQLDDAIFAELDLGKLKKKAFEIGTEAEDKKDRIVYDKESGVLRYDDDGSGKHDAQVIAVLDSMGSLKAADIFVV